MSPETLFFKDLCEDIRALIFRLKILHTDVTTSSQLPEKVVPYVNMLAPGQARGVCSQVYRPGGVLENIKPMLPRTAAGR